MASIDFSHEVISKWAYIEADFQREYGVDLSKEFFSITYRRFKVLIKGLSKNSAFVMHLYNISRRPEEISRESNMAAYDEYSPEVEKRIEKVWG